jgi:hypothetical protein
LSSTLFWTKPVPSGSPFPQNKAYLGGAVEVNKAKFYRILQNIPLL